jgi:hypothetical protein
MFHTDSKMQLAMLANFVDGILQYNKLYLPASLPIQHGGSQLLLGQLQQLCCLKGRVETCSSIARQALWSVCVTHQTEETEHSTHIFKHTVLCLMPTVVSNTRNSRWPWPGRKVQRTHSRNITEKKIWFCNTRQICSVRITCVNDRRNCHTWTPAVMATSE